MELYLTCKNKEYCWLPFFNCRSFIISVLVLKVPSDPFRWLFICFLCFLTASSFPAHLPCIPSAFRPSVCFSLFVNDWYLELGRCVAAYLEGPERLGMNCQGNQLSSLRNLWQVIFLASVPWETTSRSFSRLAYLTRVRANISWTNKSYTIHSCYLITSAENHNTLQGQVQRAGNKS